MKSRDEFVATIPRGSVLEIGPGISPFVTGPGVERCDVLNTEQLRDRAVARGFDPDRVADITYVLDDRGLAAIPGPYESVLSSHCIEHQPDLVTHLQQVERLLAPDGRYFVLCPDRRFCLDTHIASSTIAGVLEAYEEKRTRHSLRSIIEHSALTTHNNARKHWTEPEITAPLIDVERVKHGIRRFETEDAYIDVHAWYFTPQTFEEIIRLLKELDLISFEVERLFAPLRHTNEFWTVLKKC